ncbi:NADH-quinone oxidoreductase subunit N OS=Streptomyces violarus OX=67380 GN=nuoN PE=3 SV=1 [Streptomyces violarus]
MAPTLIVVGAAIVGILVEAFVPRKSRYYVQMFVSVVALAAAFAAVVALAADGYGTTKARIAAMGAIAVDGPALFLQGTILLAALVGLFTFAERRLDPLVHGNRVDSFAAQAASVRAARVRRRRSRPGSPPPRCSRCCCSPSPAC